MGISIPRHFNRAGSCTSHYAGFSGCVLSFTRYLLSVYAHTWGLLETAVYLSSSDKLHSAFSPVSGEEITCFSTTAGSDSSARGATFLQVNSKCTHHSMFQQAHIGVPFLRNRESERLCLTVYNPNLSSCGTFLCPQQCNLRATLLQNTRCSSPR